MLLPLLSGAQPAAIKPLMVGNTVPDIAFNHVTNYKTTTARLSDFKGKLIILDFWATTCMSCIYHIPACDSLQIAFNKRIQILLVNPLISRDSLSRVNRMLHLLQSRKGHRVALPVILYDEAAYALFPFHYLPHYVWIGSDGIVKAITGADELNAKNISALLNGGELHLPVKKD